MRTTSKFKPSVDGLESREVLSTVTTGLGFVAPNFIIKGKAPHVFPTGPGLFTPLAQPPHGSEITSPTGSFPIGIVWGSVRR